MEKHHSCLNTRAIIEYFEENYPGEVDRLLEGLGPEIQELANPLEFLGEINNWVSSDVVIRMFENAKQITHQKDICFKIGFEAAARKKLGYVQRIILFAYRNPRRSLRKVQQINDRFNKNKKIEVVETRRDSGIIRLQWFPEIPGNRDFCLFNKGIYTGLPTIWNLPPGIVEETKCFFDGDPYCEYHFKWQKRFSVRESLLRFLVPWRALNYTIEELERDKELLKKKFDEVHCLNIQLKEKIDQVVCLQETSTAALSVLNLEELLQVTLRLLRNVAKLDRAGILLVDDEARVLELRYGVGVAPELFDKIRNYKIPVSKVDNVIARVAMTGIPVLIQDVAKSKLNMNNPLIQYLKPTSFILAPLTVRGKVIGVLLADRAHQETAITNADKEFVVSFANQIAIALDNAMLYRKLEISERKYRELVENAHEGIWIIDEKGVIKFANRRLQEITGYDPLVGKHIHDLVDWYNMKLLTQVLNHNREGEVAQEELEMLCKDRGAAAVIMSSVPLIEQGEFNGAFAMFSDITALRETERRFQKTFEEAAIGMSLVDMKGYLLESNPALEGMLGYSKEELYKKSFLDLSHPEDVAVTARLFRELAERKRDSFRLEKRYIRKDGRVLWGQVTVSLLRNARGEAQFAISMLEEITQRKESEAEIRTYQEQLQSLASELSLTEERERRRLATDLHDHIGQALAVAKIKLGVLQKKTTAKSLAPPLAELRDLVEQMIQDTRSLTFELSLPILYELGFEAAVEWLAKHVRTQHGIQVEIKRNKPPINMGVEIRVLLFKAVRELMHNIVKHAQAHRAVISVSRNGNEVQVQVRDDGVGVDLAKIHPKLKGSGTPGGFGLFSIRERLRYLGGRLEVESAPAQGTTVTLVAPLEHDKQMKVG